MRKKGKQKVEEVARVNEILQILGKKTWQGGL